MILQIESDLHLEFADYDIEPKGDLLILAGDIGVGTKGIEFARDALKTSGQGFIYVPGNHEYYHHDIGHPELNGFQKQVHEVDGLRIALCTLWGVGGDWYQNRSIERGMSDFHVIRNGDHSFSPEGMQEIHKDHREWLLGLKDIDIVVTHHAPVPECVQPRYRGNYMNTAFHGECDDVIEKLKPMLWVHGHMHDRIDFMHNGTRIVCNPRGYVGEYGAENPDYEPMFIDTKDWA